MVKSASKKPQKKIAPFYVFLSEVQHKHWLSYGRHLPIEEAHELASEQWALFDDDKKTIYRQRAVEKSKNLRDAESIGIVAPKPVEVRPVIKKVERFLSNCGRNRVLIMNHNFITIGMNCPYQKGQDFYPGEICLVKWSINNGVQQLYHVYFNPSSIDGAFLALNQTWPSWGDSQSCHDRDTIATEIFDFIDTETTLLSRGSVADRFENCLKYLFGTVSVDHPQIVDQAIIAHHLIVNDTKNKKLPMKDIFEMFPQRTGNGLIGVTEKGIHTGVKCCWHSNNVFCAARRAVEDAFIMSSELGKSFLAILKPGKHEAIHGQLVPERVHQCKQNMQLAQLLTELDLLHQTSQNNTVD